MFILPPPSEITWTNWRVGLYATFDFGFILTVVRGSVDTLVRVGEIPFPSGLVVRSHNISSARVLHSCFCYSLCVTRIMVLIIKIKFFFLFLFFSIIRFIFPEYAAILNVGVSLCRQTSQTYLV